MTNLAARAAQVDWPTRSEITAQLQPGIGWSAWVWLALAVVTFVVAVIFGIKAMPALRCGAIDG